MWHWKFWQWSELQPYFLPGSQNLPEPETAAIPVRLSIVMNHDDFVCIVFFALLVRWPLYQVYCVHAICCISFTTSHTKYQMQGSVWQQLGWNSSWRYLPGEQAAHRPVSSRENTIFPFQLPDFLTCPFSATWATMTWRLFLLGSSRAWLA